MRKRLRVHQSDLESGDVQLSPAASHYVCRVHRLREGAELLLFDPEAGTEADAVLLVGGTRAGCRVGPVRAAEHLGFSALWLYVARPKGAALERVVRDAVSLGVGQVVLLDSEHSIPKGEERLSRLRELALDEARQCERGDVPGLAGPTTFARAVQQAFEPKESSARHLLLEPREARMGLLDALGPLPLELHATRRLVLWVGPEAGFSESERAGLIARGAVPVHLGTLVLRVASAVGAALAIVGAAAHSQGSNWALAEDAR
jgi:16S rRNA (uracil1498-N3)-methyltransferase